MEDTPKVVMMEIDRQFIRGMMISMLGGMSGMDMRDMNAFIATGDKNLLRRLAEKAEVDSEFGGAKISFMIHFMLKELFEGAMNLEKEHSKILIEMICGMVVSGSYHVGWDNLSEGPSRGSRPH